MYVSKKVLIALLVVIVLLVLALGSAAQSRTGMPFHGEFTLGGGVYSFSGEATLIGTATATPTLEPFPTPPFATPVVDARK